MVWIALKYIVYNTYAMFCRQQMDKIDENFVNKMSIYRAYNRKMMSNEFGVVERYIIIKLVRVAILWEYMHLQKPPILSNSLLHSLFSI
jgi:hypothetical protein